MKTFATVWLMAGSAQASDQSATIMSGTLSKKIVGACAESRSLASG